MTNRVGRPQDTLWQKQNQRGNWRDTLYASRDTKYGHRASGIELRLKVFLSKIYLTDNRI
jgi:hypothetical protein